LLQLNHHFEEKTIMDIVDLFVAGSHVEKEHLLESLQSHEIVHPSKSTTHLFYMLLGALVTALESDVTSFMVPTQSAKLYLVQKPGYNSHLPIIVLTYPTVDEKFQIISFSTSDDSENGDENQLNQFLDQTMAPNSIFSIRSVEAIDDKKPDQKIRFRIIDRHRKNIDNKVIETKPNFNIQTIFEKKLKTQKITEESHPNPYNLIRNATIYSINHLVKTLNSYLTNIVRNFMKITSSDNDDNSALLYPSSDNLADFISGSIGLGNLKRWQLYRLEYGSGEKDGQIVQFFWTHGRPKHSRVPIWVSFNPIDNNNFENILPNQNLRLAIACRVKISKINGDLASVSVHVRKVNINHGFLDKIVQNFLLNKLDRKSIATPKQVRKYTENLDQLQILLLGDLFRQHTDQNQWSLSTSTDPKTTVVFIKDVKNKSIVVSLNDTNLLHFHVFEKDNVPISQTETRMFNKVQMQVLINQVESARRQKSNKELMFTLLSAANEIFQTPSFNRTSFILGYMLQDCFGTQVSKVPNGNQITCSDASNTQLNIFTQEIPRSSYNVKYLTRSAHFLNFISLAKKHNRLTNTVIITAMSNKITGDFSVETFEKKDLVWYETYEQCFNRKNNPSLENDQKIFECIKNSRPTKNTPDARDVTKFLSRKVWKIGPSLNLIEMTSQHVNNSFQFFHGFILDALKHCSFFNLSPRGYTQLLFKTGLISSDTCSSGVTVALPAQAYFRTALIFMLPLSYRDRQTSFLLPHYISQKIQLHNCNCMLEKLDFSSGFGTYDEFIHVSPKFILDESQTLKEDVSVNLQHVSLRDIVQLNVSHESGSIKLELTNGQILNISTEMVEQESSILLYFVNGQIKVDSCGNSFVHVSTPCFQKTTLHHYITLTERFSMLGLVECDDFFEKFIIPNIPTRSDYSLIQLPFVNYGIYLPNPTADMLIFVDFNKIHKYFSTTVTGDDNEHIFYFTIEPTINHNTIVYFDTISEPDISVLKRDIVQTHPEIINSLIFEFQHKNQTVKFKINLAKSENYENLVLVDHTSHRIGSMENNFYTEPRVFKLVKIPINAPDWLEILVLDSTLIGSEIRLNTKNLSSCEFYRFGDTFVVSNSLATDLLATKQVYGGGVITVILPNAKWAVDNREIDGTVLGFDDARVEIGKSNATDFVDVKIRHIKKA